ncbi:MAG: manganese efflux pump [Eubacteriales bacterium]|nr:manganese efflux pump [Eubacteriales bacterium]
MSLLDVITVAFVLSLDASAVTMADAIVYRGRDIKKLIALPFLFGLFQGVMPLMGYFIMVITGLNLGVFAKLLVFLILSFIGFRMIFSYFRPVKKRADIKNDLPVASLVAQAVCTSVDAFAVGVGLAVIGGAIFIPSLIITIITVTVCFAFLFFGRRLGAAFGEKALLVGGIIIIAVGIKALF